jgi:hypothetical protein
MIFKDKQQETIINKFGYQYFYILFNHLKFYIKVNRISVFDNIGTPYFLEYLLNFLYK